MSLYGGIELPGRPDLANIERLDLLPQRAIAEMMHVGMAVDREWFSQLSSQLTTEISELRREVCDYIPPDKLDEFIARANIDDDDDEQSGLPMNVGSTQQLSKLLFEVLGIGAGKTLKRTKSGDQVSTGKKQLEQFKRDHPVVPKVLALKERTKLKSTYSDALPLMAKLHRAGSCWCGDKHPYESLRIHTQILSTRTSTGRLASKKPNLQQIPARSELGRRVRAGFIASPGMEMFAVDFSQFEMRLCAHYSMDPNFVRIFREGLDPHTDTAMRAFKKSKMECTHLICQECSFVSKDDDAIKLHAHYGHKATDGRMLYRSPCKNVGFGLLYGLTPEGLYDQMLLTYSTAGIDIPDWLTLDWCEQFMEDWFDLYPEIRGYMENQYYRARRYGVVWTLLGRIRRVPEVRSVHQRIVSAGLRQAGNAPIQGSQGDLFKIALAEIHEFIRSIRAGGVMAWLLNAVHDEVVGECEIGMGGIIVAGIEEIMSRVMVDRQSGRDLCLVPVTASGHTMERWAK